MVKGMCGKQVSGVLTSQQCCVFLFAADAPFLSTIFLLKQLLQVKNGTTLGSGSNKLT